MAVAGRYHCDVISYYLLRRGVQPAATLMINSRCGWNPVCMCVRVCMRACMHACVLMRSVWGRFLTFSGLLQH